MKVAVWILGSLEHKTTPTQETINKFKEELRKVHNGEQKDIVWGPDLTSVQVIDITPNTTHNINGASVSLYNGPDITFPQGT